MGRHFWSQRYREKKQKMDFPNLPLYLKIPIVNYSLSKIDNNSGSLLYYMIKPKSLFCFFFFVWGKIRKTRLVSKQG
jgi:hypothetical protein